MSEKNIRLILTPRQAQTLWATMQDLVDVTTDAGVRRFAREILTKLDEIADRIASGIEYKSQSQIAWEIAEALAAAAQAVAWCRAHCRHDSRCPTGPPGQATP